MLVRSVHRQWLLEGIGFQTSQLISCDRVAEAAKPDPGLLLLNTSTNPASKSVPKARRMCVFGVCSESRLRLISQSFTCCLVSRRAQLKEGKKRGLKLLESRLFSNQDICRHRNCFTSLMVRLPEEKAMISKLMHNLVNFYPHIRSTKDDENKDELVDENDDERNENSLNEASLKPHEQAQLARQAFQLEHYEFALDLLKKINIADSITNNASDNLSSSRGTKMLLDLCLINCHLALDDLDVSKTMLDDIQCDRDETALSKCVHLAVKSTATKLWTKAKHFSLAHETLIEAKRAMNDHKIAIGESCSSLSSLDQELKEFIIADSNSLPSLEATLSSKSLEPVLATCRSNPCLHVVHGPGSKEVNFITNRRELYDGDPGCKGFVQMRCTEQCVIVFHQLCFKALKESREKHNDKDLIALQCITPDCDGLISRIRRFDRNGEIVKELCDDEKVTLLLTSLKEKRSVKCNLSKENQNKIKGSKKAESCVESSDVNGQNTGVKAKRSRHKSSNNDRAVTTTTVATPTKVAVKMTTAVQSTTTRSKPMTTKVSSTSSASMSVYRYPSWADSHQMDEDEENPSLQSTLNDFPETIVLPPDRYFFNQGEGVIDIVNGSWSNGFNNNHSDNVMMNNSVFGVASNNVIGNGIMTNANHNGADVGVQGAAALSNFNDATSYPPTTPPLSFQDQQARVAQLERELAEERFLSHSIYLKFTTLTSLLQDERQKNSQLELSLSSYQQRAVQTLIELKNMALVHWGLVVNSAQSVEDQRRAEAYYNVLHNMIVSDQENTYDTEPTELAQMIALGVDQAMMAAPIISSETSAMRTDTRTMNTTTLTNPSHLTTTTTPTMTNERTEGDVSSTEKLLRDLGFDLKPEDIREVVNEANIDFTQTKKQPLDVRGRVYNGLNISCDNSVDGASSHLSTHPPFINAFDQEREECVICFESVELMPDSLEVLECGHTFHKYCFAAWVEKDKSCPICRAYIVQVKDYPPLVRDDSQK